MRVVVVGAGIVGLSAAWALKKAGHEPVLLDQGPIPNPIASSNDRHRLIRLAHSEGDGRGVIIHEAYAAWDELWEDLGRSHYVETGMLLTAREPTDWAVSCRAGFDRQGTAYEIWDRDRLARRLPFLALTDADWGLYMARGGALLADRILARSRGVAAAARAWSCASTRRSWPSTAAASVLEGGEQVAGDAVVSAAGAWSGKLLPELAPSLTPRRAVVLYLRPPAEMAEAWAESPCFLDFGGDHDLYLVRPMAGLGLKFGAGAHSGPADPTAAHAAPRRAGKPAGASAPLHQGLRPLPGDRRPGMLDLQLARRAVHAAGSATTAWSTPPPAPGRCSSSAR